MITVLWETSQPPVSTLREKSGALQARREGKKLKFIYMGIWQNVWKSFKTPKHIWLRWMDKWLDGSLPKSDPVILHTEQGDRSVKLSCAQVLPGTQENLSPRVALGFSYSQFGFQNSQIKNPRPF